MFEGQGRSQSSRS